jgi:hypothetical protein
VTVNLRVSCSSEKLVARTKLTRRGTFAVYAPAPTGPQSQIAVYQATSHVLHNGQSEITHTLPTPPSP